MPTLQADNENAVDRRGAQTMPRRPAEPPLGCPLRPHRFPWTDAPINDRSFRKKSKVEVAISRQPMCFIEKIFGFGLGAAPRAQIRGVFL